MPSLLKRTNRSRFLVVLVFLLGVNLYGQVCPKKPSTKAAIRYLQKLRAGAVDDSCDRVMWLTLNANAHKGDARALSALAGLLDLKKEYPGGYGGGAHEPFFPAINILANQGERAVPFLIAAVKNDRTGIVSENAWTAFLFMKDTHLCKSVEALVRESQKPQITEVERERLLRLAGKLRVTSQNVAESLGGGKCE